MMGSEVEGGRVSVSKCVSNKRAGVSMTSSWECGKEAAGLAVLFIALPNVWLTTINYPMPSQLLCEKASLMQPLHNSFE